MIVYLQLSLRIDHCHVSDVAPRTACFVIHHDVQFNSERKKKEDMQKKILFIVRYVLQNKGSNFKLAVNGDSDSGWLRVL